ncbi:PAS domain S-box protein [Porifericola rhodea]|uniref:PAS domain S-box protein n=1 Tax=Porifericola rhodea TaxID=930972 RepID=UPI00266602CC|nr:PAS domain S-box protein [Porifericola rhodea]WKN31188.1 PAS domain S-box protein [Porifericola rhodea]
MASDQIYNQISATRWIDELNILNAFDEEEYEDFIELAKQLTQVSQVFFLTDLALSEEVQIKLATGTNHELLELKKVVSKLRRGHSTPTIVSDIRESIALQSYLSEFSAYLFFASFPLNDKQGNLYGSLNLLAEHVHHLDEGQIQALERLCRQIVKAYESRKNELLQQENFKHLELLKSRGVDAIYLLDGEGFIQDVNKTACEMLGYTDEELLYNHITDYDSINSAEDFKKFWDVNFHKTHLHFETTQRHKRGLHIPVNMTAMPFEQYNKKFIWLVVKDLRERNKKNKQLIESEQLHRFMTEYSSELICLHDPDGTYNYLSPSVKHLLGYEPGELVGIDPYSIFHPEDRQRVREETHQALLSGDKRGSIEYRIRKKDGSYVWFDTIAEAIRAHDDKIIYITTNSREVTDKKLAQEALIQSEEKYRFLVENTSDFITLRQEDGRFVYLPANIDKLTGYTAEELYKLDPFDLIVEEDREIIKAKFAAALYKSNANSVLEYRIQKKNNEIIWIQTRVRLIRGNHEKPTYFLTTSNEITNSKLAEKALQNSERKFRLLFQNMNMGFVLGKIITDELQKPVDIIFLDVNPYFEKLLNLNRKDVINRKLSDLLPGIESYWIEQFGEVALGGEAREYSNYAKTFQSYFDAKIYSPHKGYFAVTFSNVTDKIKIEKALKDAETRYRTFIESVSEGVYRFELKIPLDTSLSTEEQVKHIYDHTFLAECNQEFLKMYRTKAEDVVGLPLSTFHGGRMLKDNQEVVKKFIESGYRIVQEETIEHDVLGNTHYFSNNTVGIVDEDGYLTRFWGTQTDITKIKEYERELIMAKEKAEEKEKELQQMNKEIAARNLAIINSNKELSESNEKILHINKELHKANQELDNFVYRVSHDLRSPVATCLALIDLSLHEDNPQQLKEFLLMQEKSLRKQDKFIHDILDYSQNTRKQALPKEIQLKSMIEDVIQENSNDYRDTNCSLEVNDAVELVCDEMRLQIVVSNLISNAFKYSMFKDEPLVKVSAKVTPQELLLRVVDNGIGIPKKEQERVFEMFYRATNRSNGSGLGLYIVKEAIYKMNGEIKLESEVGEGAAFTIKVPNLIKEKNYAS